MAFELTPHFMVSAVNGGYAVRGTRLIEEEGEEKWSDATFFCKTHTEVHKHLKATLAVVDSDKTMFESPKMELPRRARK